MCAIIAGNINLVSDAFLEASHGATHSAHICRDFRDAINCISSNEGIIYNFGKLRNTPCYKPT